MVSLMQASFTGGEWAPSLHARVDLAKYATAVKTMRNFVMHAHGGASNRGGTEFLGETKYSSKASRLVSFEFSVIQAYALEFGDQYMRVYKDGARVAEADQNITGISQASQAVVSLTAHGYANGDWLVIEDVVGMTEVNGKVVVVSDKTTDDFKIKDTDGNYIDSTGYTAYTSGGTAARVFDLATPYLEADLPLLKFTQSADILYVFHPSYAPRKISRTGHAAWTIDLITFGASLAAPTSFARSSGSGTGHTYAVTAVSTDGEESLVSNAVAGGAGDVYTWTAPAGSVDFYNFYEEVNGVYQWLGYAATNTYTVPSSLDPDATSSPPKSRDPFPGANDYPGVGAFFQQRLEYARTNNKPQTIFGSVTGSFYNMNVASPLRDDDAYNFTINSQKVNEIRWMIPLTNLIIGTSGGIWKMGPGQAGGSVTGKSVDLVPQTGTGVSDLPALLINSTILYVDRSLKKVRDLQYALEVDGYQGNDLSILSNHLFKGHSIVDWCYQEDPDSVVWAVRDDGVLLGLTYQREHEVWGWHRHDTQGYFESVASIPTAEGSDDVYAIVKRTVNSTTRRYVELFKDRMPTDDVADAYFVDCGLSYDGDPITEVTGLDHLEGMTVAVLADGNVVKDLVVTDGAITLSHAASKIHVGLGYTSDLESLNFEYQTQQGTVQDKPRYVSSVLVKLENTRALFVGPPLIGGSDDSRLEEIPFRTTEDYGDPIELYTGDYEVPMEQGESFRNASVFCRNTDPVPVTILAMIPRVVHGEV